MSVEGKMVYKTVLFKVQSMIDKRWVDATLQTSEKYAEAIYKENKKDYPDTPFRIVRIETVTSVVKISTK